MKISFYSSSHDKHINIDLNNKTFNKNYSCYGFGSYELISKKELENLEDFLIFNGFKEIKDNE